MIAAKKFFLLPAYVADCGEKENATRRHSTALVCALLMKTR
jgi:hypothetical protein